MWSTFWFIMLLVLCFTYQSDDLGNATFFPYKEKNWAWMLSIYCIYVGQPCWNDQENYMIDMVDCFIHFLASYCTRWYCFSVIFSCAWLNNATPAYLNNSIASLSKHYPSCPMSLWQWVPITRLSNGFLPNRVRVW
jgi:hypothetical protein